MDLFAGRRRRADRGIEAVGAPMEGERAGVSRLRNGAFYVVSRRVDSPLAMVPGLAAAHLPARQSEFFRSDSFSAAIRRSGRQTARRPVALHHPQFFRARSKARALYDGDCARDVRRRQAQLARAHVGGDTLDLDSTFFPGWRVSRWLPGSADRQDGGAGSVAEVCETLRARGSGK